MPDDALVWTVRLSDGAPHRRMAIFGVALAAAALGWFGFGRPLWGILGFAMILSTTAEHWLGCRFRLDGTGARSRVGPSVTAMPWGEVRRVLVKGREVRLSPLESPSTLDAFRGVALLTTPENRSDVMAFVRDHAPQATEVAA